MKKCFYKRTGFYFCILIALTVILSLYPSFICEADEPYIIVIDPGHSGENLGAQFDGYTEKEMNMAVAKAMKEELERYDNVVVYLTHEDDSDMSIKDRALFAKEKNADFLFCLHFNASVHHNLYGAEVWIPAYDDFYVLGRKFAEIEMQLLSEHGLYSRGIKTKLNDKEEDYYGILRHCSAVGVPSVLIEHCHMDNDNDKPFYQNGDQQFVEFGKLDATAVARYLGLSSAELNVDYSDYPLASVEVPKSGEPVRPDKTEPEICEVEILSLDEKTGELSVRMKASDADSYIQYYCYSLDGGETYSELYKWRRPFWNQSDEEMIFTIMLPKEQDISLTAKAYNSFDVFTESNTLSIPVLSRAEENPAVEKIVLDELDYEEHKLLSGFQISDKILLILLILLISILMTFIFYALIKMTGALRKSRKGSNRQKKQ